MKVLVTGGAGFIGSHILDHALAAGHEVAALDNLSAGKKENLPEGVKLYEVDVRDRDKVREAFADFRPDAVSHQAAQASVSVSMKDPALDAAVNVIGGIIVAEAALEFGATNFVFASTGGAIYGNVAEGCAKENHATVPISPYAIDKLAFEQLLGVYRRERGLRPVILRYANVFGPRQDPHGEAGVVAIFFNKAFAGDPIQINAMRKKGDDGCIRDYVFVTDVARANLLALEGKLGAPVMNIGTGVGTSTAALGRAILELAGSMSEVRHGDLRAGDIERSVLDGTIAKGEIGAFTGISAGLAETAAWYKRSQ